ncbi:hypothetical protein [Arthrobacter agilis]|uniref:hypothetical protein n=1 Tax=Arthrobacter agilis TaxID=37921 RepID=UPI0027D7E887|nr:hypothetical protein [Arthrobacter agilis]
MTGSDSTGSAVRGAQTETADRPRRSRRAAEAPLDAVPAPRRERESQVRARNREALRTFRALADGPGTQDDAPVRIETPTRRQLRLQQVEGRAVAPAVGAVPGAGTTVEADGTGSTDLPAASEVTGTGTDSRPTDDGHVVPEAEADSPPSAAGHPSDPERDAGRAGASAVGAAQGPVPGGRRDRRRQTAPVADAPQDAQHGAETEAPGRRPEDMSVAEALAARNAIAAEARDHAAALQAAGTDDPFTVDLRILAQQKALAERAAVLNSRARRVQELSEQNQQPTPVSGDPSTAHNLSIITPPEFVDGPGGSRTVLRAPATSSVPVVLPRQASGDAAGPLLGAADSSAPAHPDARGTEPIRARSAFGLDPLDAMTAGLGRVRRVRYLQYSLLGVGAAALSTGIVLTVSSLNG